MYAKVAKVAVNQGKKLMVFDKTGTGVVLSYDVTEEEGRGPLVDHHSEEVGTCELLNNVRDFAVTAIGSKIYVSGGYDMRDESPVNALIM